MPALEEVRRELVTGVLDYSRKSIPPPDDVLYDSDPDEDIVQHKETKASPLPAHVELEEEEAEGDMDESGDPQSSDKPRVLSVKTVDKKVSHIHAHDPAEFLHKTCLGELKVLKFKFLNLTRVLQQYMLAAQLKKSWWTLWFNLPGEQETETLTKSLEVPWTRLFFF